jgi:hypothetical protein
MQNIILKLFNPKVLFRGLKLKHGHSGNDSLNNQGKSKPARKQNYFPINIPARENIHN